MAIDLTESPTETAQFEAMMNEQPMPEAKPESVPEVKPETPPTPKPEVEAKPAEPKEEKPVRLVPHQALHEARLETKKERDARVLLEQRVAELEKGNRPQPQSGDQEPDETTDPIGTIAWLKAQRAREQQEREQVTQQTAYLQDLQRKVQTRVDSYAAEHPEYVEQIKFLREFRFKELTEGLGYPPETAAAQVQNEEIVLGKMAVDQDMDPGAMVAKLASVRGWKQKEEPKSETPAAPKPDPEAEKKIERLQRGQKAAVSPSGAGGGGPEPEMSLEQLLTLDGAAFDKAFEKHGKRLMGG